jgi:hypothetical protein
MLGADRITPAIQATATHSRGGRGGDVLVGTAAAHLQASRVASQLANSTLAEPKDRVLTSVASGQEASKNGSRRA